MEMRLSLPHRVCDAECYVNGLEDILAWKGQRYAEHLLSVVGGMAGFSYLRFTRATPPNMVFWGTNPKNLVQNLEEVIGLKQTLLEGAGSSSVVSKLEALIDQGRPVMAGALDMYYLRYYPKLYRTQHIPIHYLLVIGYDPERRDFLVQDCGRKDVQRVPYREMLGALNVSVPGMSKRNTLRVFDLPGHIPSELEVAREGFRLKAEQMLRPPVALFGIPAMRRLSEEVLRWRDKASFEHVVKYATAPPVLPESFENSHGMRLWQGAVLRRLARKYRVEVWHEASRLFEDTGKLIAELCRAAMRRDGRTVSARLEQVANKEERAYCLLEQATSSVSA